MKKPPAHRIPAHMRRSKFVTLRFTAKELHEVQQATKKVKEKRPRGVSEILRDIVLASIALNNPIDDIEQRVIEQATAPGTWLGDGLQQSTASTSEQAPTE